MITEDDVRYIANLARLHLDEKEIREYKEDLKKILEYVEKLKEVDTESVEPISHINEVSSVMREDVVFPSFERKEMLKSAPETDGEFFIVPRVIED